jgi:hypothetical protein
MCQNETDMNLNLMDDEFASDGRKLKNVSFMYTLCLLTYIQENQQNVSLEDNEGRLTNCFAKFMVIIFII